MVDLRLASKRSVLLENTPQVFVAFFSSHLRVHFVFCAHVQQSHAYPSAQPWQGYGIVRIFSYMELQRYSSSTWTLPRDDESSVSVRLFPTQLACRLIMSLPGRVRPCVIRNGREPVFAALQPSLFVWLA